DGQWSMVVAIRSRSMGSEAREGMGCAQIRCCRGIGWGAGQLASVLSPRPWTWGLGRRSIGPWPGWPLVYPGRRLDFAGNAYPALTRTPIWAKEIALADVRISSVISIWWAHKDSNLGPAD